MRRLLLILTVCGILSSPRRCEAQFDRVDQLLQGIEAIAGPLDNLEQNLKAKEVEQVRRSLSWASRKLDIKIELLEIQSKKLDVQSEELNAQLSEYRRSINSSSITSMEQLDLMRQEEAEAKRNLDVLDKTVEMFEQTRSSRDALHELDLQKSMLEFRRAAERMQAAEVGLAQVMKLRDQGLVPEGEVLNAESRLNAVKAELESFEIERQRMEEQLKLQRTEELSAITQEAKRERYRVELIQNQIEQSSELPALIRNEKSVLSELEFLEKQKLSFREMLMALSLEKAYLETMAKYLSPQEPEDKKAQDTKPTE